MTSSLLERRMTPLPDTRQSLLARLASPDDAEAWREFSTLYERAVFRYACSRGLQEIDARDAVGRVWLAVHQVVGQWKPTGRPGSFRAWLFRTTHRLCLKILREQRRLDRGAGGSDVVQALKEQADRATSEPVDELDWRRWAFCWAAGKVEGEVEPSSWRAFVMTAVEGISPAEAARRLNTSVGAIYAAKCRVLARIRRRVEQLSRVES